MSFFTGSGVVTRRPLVLQLVHVASKTKPVKKSQKDSETEKPKGEENGGDKCKKNPVLEIDLLQTNHLETLTAESQSNEVKKRREC